MAKEVILRHDGDRNPKLMLTGVGLAVLGLLLAGASTELGMILVLCGVGALVVGARKRTKPCPSCRTKISPRAATCPQCHSATAWAAA